MRIIIDWKVVNVSFGARRGVGVRHDFKATILHARMRAPIRLLMRPGLEL